VVCYGACSNIGARLRHLRGPPLRHRHRYQQAHLAGFALAPARACIFPRVSQRNRTIFAVVDAPTAELASRASTALAERLSRQEDLFRSVDEPQNSALFVRDGLLFLPTDELERSLGALTQAQPLLQTLVTDPSLRGLQQVLSLGLTGVQIKRIALDAMTHTLSMAAVTLENVLAGPSLVLLLAGDDAR
jgi:hypothetical protein